MSFICNILNEGRVKLSANIIITYCSPFLTLLFAAGSQFLLRLNEFISQGSMTFQ